MVNRQQTTDIVHTQGLLTVDSCPLTKKEKL